MFKKILVGIDGSPASEKALVAAVDLAVHYKAEATAISVAAFPEVVSTVGEADEVRRSAEARYRQIGEAAVEYAKSRGVLLRSVVVRGHAVDAIVRYAETEGADLVVLGQH